MFVVRETREYDDGRIVESDIFFALAETAEEYKALTLFKYIRSSDNKHYVVKNINIEEVERYR